MNRRPASLPAYDAGRIADCSICGGNVPPWRKATDATTNVPLAGYE